MECLVTKLKGVVNDDSLNQLGVLHLFQPYNPSANNTSTFLRIIAGNNNITIKTDGKITEGGSNSIIAYANTERAIHIENKVGGTNIWIDSVYDIKYLQTSEQFFFSKREFDSLCSNKNLRGFMTYSAIPEQYQFTADGSSFKNMQFIALPKEIIISNERKIIENKSIISFYHIGTTLKIEDFQNIDTVQSLDYIGGDFSKLPKNIRQFTQTSAATYTGTVEDFVQNMRTSDRTTGAIKFVWIKTANGITFENKQLNTYWSEKGYTENDGFISWDSSSITITNTQPESYVAPEDYRILLDS